MIIFKLNMLIFHGGSILRVRELGLIKLELEIIILPLMLASQLSHFLLSFGSLLEIVLLQVGDLLLHVFELIILF